MSQKFLEIGKEQKAAVYTLSHLQIQRNVLKKKQNAKTNMQFGCSVKY